MDKKYEKVAKDIYKGIKKPAKKATIVKKMMTAGKGKPLAGMTYFKKK